jgi:hypothetical protein
MIYSKDINKRSPLRVFERSIHGGLGRGNVGLVMSRAGVGKTAFLVGVALDDCMRDRKVLHVDTEHNAERVREYYEEVFRDLAATENLENREDLRVRIERNRMIHSFLNGSFHLGRLREALGYMKAHLGFEPGCIVLDGHPAWEKEDPEAIEAELKEVKQLAVDTQARCGSRPRAIGRTSGTRWACPCACSAIWNTCRWWCVWPPRATMCACSSSRTTTTPT